MIEQIKDLMTKLDEKENELKITFDEKAAEITLIEESSLSPAARENIKSHVDGLFILAEEALEELKAVVEVREFIKSHEKTLTKYFLS